MMTTTIADALIRDLAALLSPGALVTDEQERAASGRDFWDQRGIPGLVVRASRAEDVASTLRFAAVHGIPVVPRAAGTNIGVGFVPTPERIMLDLRPLDRVLSIDPARRLAVVEPGVLNGALQQQLAPLGLCFSPDPASVPISTVGGNIAENAGGPHCLKYGVTVHHVEAVDCALPGGDMVELRANDTGPDLLGVLIGSEGTLGVVTRATVRLRPLPAITRGLLASFTKVEEATEAVSAIIAAGVVPAALEFFDRAAAVGMERFAPSGYSMDAEATLLIDIEGEPDAVAADLASIEALLRRTASEVRRADDDAARAALWRGRLLAGQAIAASGLGYLIGDTTVPRERIPAMQREVYRIAAARGVYISTTGHAGDGNVHPTIFYNKDDPDAVAAMHRASEDLIIAALSLGGTVTGEHGVGSEKRGFMARRFNPAELAAMRAVKAAFDPRGILNPGVLLPDPLPDDPHLPLFAAAARAAVDAARGRHGPADSARAAHPSPHAQAERRPVAIAVDQENLTVTASAAVTLADLRDALAARRLHCALSARPDGADLTRSLGNVVSSATGAKRAAVRDCILAVGATLPEGDMARFGSSAVKDVAGYDLKRLYIDGGARFGHVDEVTLKVAPLPH